VYASFEVGLQPLGEIFNELLAKVASVARPTLLEWVVQVLLGDVRDVDGVSTKIKEVMGDQGTTVFPINFRFGIDPVSVVGLAILIEADDLINSHGVDQLAMTGTLPQVHTACSGDPVADLSQLDDVPLLRAVLALRQSAEAPERVRSKPVIVIDNVGKEFCHVLSPIQTTYAS
jgi:hypothetical protein